MKDKNFMGTQPIGTLLRKLSLPAMIGMLTNAFYNLADTIFVGQGVGPLGIAGVSIAFPFQLLTSSFALAYGIGGASIVSRKLGEKDEEGAAMEGGNAFSITIITALVLTIFGFLFLDPILIFLGSSQTILPYARAYLSIILFGSIFQSFSMCANNLIRSDGSAKESMLIMMTGMVLNIVLDPIFIFVLDMGIKGAATATVISQLVSAFLCFRFFITKKSSLKLHRSSFKLKWKLIKETALLGTATFIRQIGTSVLTMVANRLLGTYGGDIAVSTYGIINKLTVFFTMPVFGINQGLQPIAGFNYGAHLYDRVREVLKKSMIWSFILGLFGSVVCLLFPKTILLLFTNDAEVLAMATPALRIVMSTVVLIGIQACGTTYFQSIGKSSPAILLGMSRQFLFLIPIILLLSHFNGLQGIWISFPFSDILATIVTVIFTLVSVKKLGKE